MKSNLTNVLTIAVLLVTTVMPHLLVSEARADPIDIVDGPEFSEGDSRAHSPNT